MDNKVKVEIITGTWKTDKTKTWKGVKFTIGDWSKLVFPDSSFETEYIEKILAEHE